MKEIKIKTELLPKRCEVCHQEDSFNAETNYCSRCDLVEKTYIREKGHISIRERYHKALFYSCLYTIIYTLYGRYGNESIGSIFGNGEIKQTLTALVNFAILILGIFIFPKVWFVYKKSREQKSELSFLHQAIILPPVSFYLIFMVCNVIGSLFWLFWFFYFKHSNVCF